MAGVSRTTVSNVLHGKTKRVSQNTIDKIKRILDEYEYVPNMGSMMISGKGSKIIGFVLGYEWVHGYAANMDPFIGNLLAAIRNEAEKQGYYVMIIGGEKEEKLVDIASRWNVDGLILMGYSEIRYASLRKKLNKKAVLIDTYSSTNTYDYQNVGIDDYSGGYQLGKYLLDCGYPQAMFIVEETKTVLKGDRHKSKTLDYHLRSGLCNDRRWLGFKAAMEERGDYCSMRRQVIVDQKYETRMKQYEEYLPEFLKAGAIALGSDYNAIELINFFHDKGIRVPDEISVTGFDDCMYCEFVRPRLTTVHQDIDQKGTIAVQRLVRMLQGEVLPENCVMQKVKLVIRDSVYDKRKIKPDYDTLNLQKR